MEKPKQPHNIFNKFHENRAARARQLQRSPQQKAGEPRDLPNLLEKNPGTLLNLPLELPRHSRAANRVLRK